jgi:dihydropteroate synthase
MLHPLGLPEHLKSLDRTLVMGVLNVTPDSFSDGGKYLDVPSAIAHAQQLITDGADIIDIGGESTRPGADRITTEEELARVIPVIKALDKSTVISIDTMRSEVALAAVDAGATIINDVSGGMADLDMFEAVAKSDAPYICMHWRGHSQEMYAKADYLNVVEDVIEELAARVELAVFAGIDRRKIVVDPGLGFAKLPEHNWALLSSILDLSRLGLPVLVGASRKRFLKDLGVDPDMATHAVTAYLAANKVWAVRVHDVAGSVSVIRALDEVGDISE